MAEFAGKMSAKATPSELIPTPDRRRAGRRHIDRVLLEQARELKAAQRISEALFQHTDIDALVEAALRSALAEVNAEAGSVLLADADTQQLVFHYSLGDKPVPKGTAIPWNQGISGRVYQTGEPAIISDVKTTGSHFSGIDQATGFVTRDMITLPLKRWKGDPIGVMNVLNKRDGTLNEDDLALLTIVSAFAALAIQQARLFEEAKLAEVVRLLGDIGHDLKNLLQPVVSGTWLLKSELDDMFDRWSTVDPDKREARRIICEESVKMLERARVRIHAFFRERLPGQIDGEVQGLIEQIESASRLLKDKLADPSSLPDSLDAEKVKLSRATCEEALGMIQRTSDRIHDRVKEIADCVKGLSAPPKFDGCRVTSVVHEVFDTLRIVAAEKQIALIAKDLDGLPVIQADERRLYNAFYNLVNNALPETPSGGTITVSGQFQANDQALTLAVADTGRGMPPDVRDRLFSAKAVTTKKGGTGLGTKIVKDVVEAHRGRIWVESEVGAGTTFFVRLPLDPRESGRQSS